MRYYVIEIINLMIKNIIIIAFVFTNLSIFSQMDTGIGGPVSYSKFSVKDCFINSFFHPNFKSETFKPNYLLKGSTIWRTISLENKQNKQLLSTDSKCIQVSLIEIIKFGLFEKKLNAFSTDNFNEAQKSVLSAKQLSLSLSVKDTSEIISFDANGNETKNTIIENRYIMAKDIVNYLIKEDWIINNYSGQLEKYIIAIAPLVKDKKTDKTIPLFWLYFLEWQGLLNAFEARNYLSNERITFKYVFEKNYFVSQISKENNLFDRSVKSTNHGQDAYLESEIIKEKVRNFESDMFQH